jgi:histone H2A
VTIASGGVLPKIHPELLAKKKGGKFVMGNNMPLTVPYKKPIATKPISHHKKPSLPVPASSGIRTKKASSPSGGDFPRF